MKHLLRTSGVLVKVTLAILWVAWQGAVACASGHWEVAYKATGVGVANTDEGPVSGPWQSQHATIFSEECHGPGVSGATFATSSGSVTAHLTWVEAGANDLPPKKIYVREFANASARAWCPLHDSRASLNNGFKDAIIVVPTGEHEEYKKSEGVHLTILDNSARSDKVRVPTRHMEASGDNNCPGGAGGADVDFTYRVEVINFSLKARRKGTPTFGQQVNVAAGANDLDDHLTDLEVTTNPVLAEVPVKVETVIGYGGGGTNANVTMYSNFTDAAGKITGTFRSGDVVQQVTLELDTGQVANVVVNQKWADLEDSTRWDYNSQLQYGVASPITFKPKFKDGAEWIPIKGHSMTFKVTKIKYQVWDSATNNYRIETSTDPVVIAPVASFSPSSGIMGGETGEYASQLTINRTAKVLSEVHFQVEDEGVLTLW